MKHEEICRKKKECAFLAGSNSQKASSNMQSRRRNTGESNKRGPSAVSGWTLFWKPGYDRWNCPWAYDLLVLDAAERSCAGESRFRHFPSYMC